MHRVSLPNPRALGLVVAAYGGAAGLAARIDLRDQRMVLAWLKGKKLPIPKRAERVNALARAKGLRAPFRVIEETLPPPRPGDRAHRDRTFRPNQELGALIREVGDIFLFAEAIGVTVATAYRWLSRSFQPLPHLAAKANELARARKLTEPFHIEDETRFRGRGKMGAVIRAYGGVGRFARAAGASETTVRVWARSGRAANPLPGMRAKVNGLAKQAHLPEPFARERRMQFRGRGPLAALIRACGGVQGLAREAGVGETSVYRWLRGTPPWRSVAADVNALARARGVAEPFDVSKCPVRGTDA